MRDQGEPREAHNDARGDMEQSTISKLYPIEEKGSKKERTYAAGLAGWGTCLGSVLAIAPVSSSIQRPACPHSCLSLTTRSR